MSSQGTAATQQMPWQHSILQIAQLLFQRQHKPHRPLSSMPMTSSSSAALVQLLPRQPPAPQALTPRQLRSRSLAHHAGPTRRRRCRPSAAAESLRSMSQLPLGTPCAFQRLPGVSRNCTSEALHPGLISVLLRSMQTPSSAVYCSHSCDLHDNKIEFYWSQFRILHGAGSDRVWARARSRAFWRTHMPLARCRHPSWAAATPSARCAHL